MEIREYTNGEVTIVWKQELCKHSTNCWRGLPEVFRPKEKPWITVRDSATAVIIDQVAKCPSGALTTYLNSNKS